MPASVSGTIPMGAFPVGVAVDPTSNNVYVVNSPQASFCKNAGTVPGGVVTLIDGTSGSVTGAANSLSPFEISEPSSWVTAGPLAIAIDSATNKAYIAVNAVQCRLPTGQLLFGSSSLVAFDLATQVASLVWSAGTISADAFQPGCIGVDTATGKIYVAEDYASNNTSWIRVIDTATGSVTTLTDPGTGPVAVAVNSATNKIYVANFQSNNVTVIDGATGALSTVTDPNAMSPGGIAVNQTTNTIYVTNAHSNNLSVIDGSTDSVTARISVGTSPAGVAVDPQTNFIYVANAGNLQTGDPGSVTVINGSINATTTLVDPRATNPVAVAVNSATHKVYVANRGSNNVTVIDGAR